MWSRNSTGITRNRRFFAEQSAVSPKALLMILCLAYATQHFASEEIAHSCQTDPVYKTLSDSQPPFAQELIAFRRHNRAVILHVLEETLAHCCSRTIRCRAVHERAIMAMASESALERLDTARHMDVQVE
jgi:hypothetical protein